MSGLLFGRATFAEGEEYKRFQYRFTCSILVFSILITALFHLLIQLGQTYFDPTYLQVSRTYLALSVLHYAVLWGRPWRLPWVAWSYAVFSCLLHASTFFLNSPDELRVIWILLNLPGFYLVLGQRAGIGITLISIVFLILANPHLATPYSDNAVFTFILGLCYLSALFHAFAAKSISFHHAMVEANQKLSEMASRDPLTGLYNARAYYALCDGALRQNGRSHRLFTMLFVDLDHFKSVNDQYGHAAGDLVLKAVAGVLSMVVRQSDMVGRIGGEEFSLLLPDTDQEGAVALAEKIRRKIEALMPDIGDRRLPITASIGVAGGHGETSFIEVQKQADEAMYAAKKSGRNKVTCLDLSPKIDEAPIQQQRVAS